jgi:hypothetical protein
MTDNPRIDAASSLPPAVVDALRQFVDWWGMDAYSPPLEVREAVRRIVSAFLAAAAPLPDDIAGLVERLRKEVDDETSAYAADIQQGAEYGGSVPEYIAITIKDALDAAAALERQAREIERLKQTALVWAETSDKMTGAVDRELAKVDGYRADIATARSRAEAFEAALAKAREALADVLARDAAMSLSRRPNDCGCPTLSREAEREYEMGRCPHQRARAALSEIDALKAGDAPAPVVTDDMIERAMTAYRKLAHGPFRPAVVAAITAALTPQEQSDDH